VGDLRWATRLGRPWADSRTRTGARAVDGKSIDGSGVPSKGFSQHKDSDGLGVMSPRSRWSAPVVLSLDLVSKGDAEKNIPD
jgi:hypothetical protein